MHLVYEQIGSKHNFVVVENFDKKDKSLACCCFVNFLTYGRSIFTNTYVQYMHFQNKFFK